MTTDNTELARALHELSGRLQEFHLDHPGASFAAQGASALLEADSLIAEQAQKLAEFEAAATGDGLAAQSPTWRERAERAEAQLDPARLSSVISSRILDFARVGDYPTTADLVDAILSADLVDTARADEPDPTPAAPVEIRVGQLWGEPQADGSHEPFRIVKVLSDRAKVYWPRATPGWQHGHKRLSAFSKCVLIGEGAQ